MAEIMTPATRASQGSRNGVMTKHWFPMNTEQVLGSVGLFLLLVIARLADRGYGPQQTLAVQVSGFMARRTIDVIAVVGWLVDRLPGQALARRPAAHAPTIEQVDILAAKLSH